ncbi:N-acetyltransferase 10, partial [Tulasnella sp. 427]
MRKQLDPRLPTLIANNVKKNHRSFIVLVGDKARDQIVNLHYLLSQARVSARPSVLWCYKKDLGFTTHRKSREDKINKQVKRGKREAGERTPFELFISVTDIRYTYYKESHKILGNTYGMCILQDFEAITPNVLARTIETVEGGGVIVLMLKTMTSLRQLYSLTMDVHSRYRTSAHTDVVARFNERFILSLGSCEDCLVLDDELNVLPISRGKDILPIEENDLKRGKGQKVEKELKELKDSLAETKPIGELVKLARTLDQAKAILTFVDAIAEKTLSSTVTLTAARGRGKSAALGLAIAAALAHGYSNIFVTSPSPENLKTLFEFIFKGMDVLGYEEHLDYDIAQSTNPEFNKAIVRVNVFKGHRQTIQYIQPQDAHVLGQAELVIIDEAAAIPLPLVRNLIGPYLVFMASTISGYEGTGRSLSLKLIQQLRESTRPSLTKDGADDGATNATTVVKSSKSGAGHGSTLKARSLREIKLEEPIRYSLGDQIERWLNTLLCLDASILPPTTTHGTPHPSQCNLYAISRDTLFSFHPASEVFLQRIMALYVSSHYKNSPNDLQLMSDAPAHQLFVLLPPLKEDQNTLPEPLVVIQVALEGGIAKQSILDSLGRGERSDGDLIPWLMSMQFQDNNFAELSGARVVRIATHPDYSNMGYGARALQALEIFYRGEYFNLDESEAVKGEYTRDERMDEDATLDNETIAPRAITSLPPLLQTLSSLKPPPLDYMGVSYGLTAQLLRFWKRGKYVPLYVRQTKNELTGECSCVMLKSLAGDVGHP